MWTFTFSSPHPQHHPQCTSPDVEEVEREGDVGEGDALKPFLNCHDFPWKPIEGKPSLKLMIHWLEVAFLPFHVLLFVHLVRHQICAIFLNSGGNIIIHLEKQPFQDRALPQVTQGTIQIQRTLAFLTVVYCLCRVFDNSATKLTFPQKWSFKTHFCRQDEGYCLYLVGSIFCTCNPLLLKRLCTWWKLRQLVNLNLLVVQCVGELLTVMVMV